MKFCRTLECNELKYLEYGFNENDVRGGSFGGSNVAHNKVVYFG